ncbi:stage V sporulation protein B [Anaerocolumna cellulosilytica]|uniref:Stage V sporulation protein B n=1 Tax=Anaerocolumna cellulosilytica TaxID=433286 RepID=A0A6S6R223_9FIRM|nr:polysaccharide biosynthesis protein [Anaerocolumna cellulosilytica]MBB5197176.1 stage V sporulation protein B [Anaerocolumna cellulosilytica]BCJ95389.1 stage V sporulation protein B [Anaerocolumna cellulosilytica]
MGTGKKSNNFLMQGSILALASIIVRLIGLLYRIPLTNIIGDEGIGYYSNAFAIYNIALILSSYSLPLAVSKLVAARAVNKQHKNSYRVFLCSMCFAIIVGTIAALAVYFGADFLAATIYNSPRSAIPLKILAPTIFIFAIMGVLRGYFQGKNTMLPTSVSQVLEQVVNAIVSIIAAYYLMKAHSASDSIAAYGAAGGTLGTFAGACLALIFLAFIFALYKPIIDKQLRKDTHNRRETYQEVLKALIITVIPVILSQTVYQISGVLDGSIFGHVMAGKGLNEEARNALWGIYSNKYNLLITVPVSIASAMAVAIIPSLVSSKENGSNAEVKEKVHQAIKFNMLIAIPAAVGMGVLASPILQLLFRDGRELPANLVRLGSIAIIFFSLSTITNAVLQGINRMNTPVIHSAISLGVHIILLYILLKYFNLSTYGLVIGNVTFSLVVCILNWIAIGRHLNYKQEVIKTFLIPAGCSVIMGVVAFLVYQGLYSLIHINSICTLIAVVIAVIVYGSLLLLFKGVTEAELTEMPFGRTLARIAVKLHLL